MSDPLKEIPWSQLSPDKPGREPDAFQRDGIVKALAKLLCLPPNASSTVVGLEGKWGSGKTFCIHMLETELKASKPKPIVLHYEPWILSNIDSLVEGFFTQLGADLNAKPGNSKRLQATSEKFKHVGSLLSVAKLIPGAEPWISLLQSGMGQASEHFKSLGELTSMDLRGQLKDLGASIIKMGRPVIVIIDDLDRLQPEQVRLVFQLVKTVGDLPRVAYLMAYDRMSVVNALTSANILNAESYLEKMVQFPVRLPRWALIHKKSFLENKLRDVFRQMKVELSKHDKDLLGESITDTDLLLTLGTPRDVIRICNGLLFYLSVLDDEVCFADLLVLEAIHIRMPKLYDFISSNHQMFINPYDFNIETKTIFGEIGAMTRALEKRHSDKEDSRLAVVLNDENFTSYNRDFMHSLLRFIFPTLLPHHDESEIDPRRLCHPDALYKVLQVGTMDFTFNRETAKAFLQEDSLRELLLKDAVAQGNYNGFLLSTAQWIQYLPVVDTMGIYNLLVSALNSNLQGHYDVDPHRVSSDFLKRCILASTHEISNDVLQRIMKDEQNLLLSGLLLQDILQKYFLWENTTGTFEEIREDDIRKSSVSSLPLSYEDVYAAKGIWLDTVNHAKTHRDLFIERGAPFILSFSSKLHKSKLDTLQELTASTVSSPESLPEFLKNFSTYKELRNEILSYFPDLKALLDYLEAMESEDAVVAGWIQALREMIAAQKNGDPQCIG